ncbi:hypothetical protein [Streptomyces sp. NPDC059893]|uniref:hypothetical protein n=1 Tax=Streptomyces sp. NPDC059893 TaxID=3346990 RepID=UPI003661EBA3
MWVFCAINAHWEGKLRITSVQGARVTFSWKGPWKLAANSYGRVLLDLGQSPQLGAHVLLEIDQFDLHGQDWGSGTAVLRDAQVFCRWMRDGTPLLPYYPDVAHQA